MDNQEKLKALQDYFQSEFPGSEIESRYEPREKVHEYRILCGGKTHRAIVLETFLNACEAEQIPTALKEFTLAEHLREMGETTVVVTMEGLKLEGD